MKPRAPAVKRLPPASETPRQAMRRLLSAAPCTAHELSRLVHLPEKDVAAHLEHLARGLRRGAERLRVTPARCLGCGHVFHERSKLTCPGACPACRGQHIAAPVFEIARRPG